MRRCLPQVFVLIVLSGIVCCSSDAYAEPADEQEVQAAQELFEEGMLAYQAKKFPEAIVLFQKAYTYVPAAAFLYNAAKVAEAMGDFDQALKFAERAGAQTEEALPDQMAQANRKLIESLKIKIAEEASRAEAARRAEESHAAAWSWVGYSGVGAGIAGLGLIGGATYLGMKASSDFDELSRVEDEAVYTNRRADIESSQKLGRAILYSGIGLVALGGGLVAWDLLSPHEHPVTVSLGPTSGGAGEVGLQLLGEF